MKKIILLVCCVFLSSCATVFTSGEQKIGLYTSDSGPASVMIITSEEGGKIISLPNEIEVGRSSDDIIINVLEDDSTQPSIQIVRPGINPVFYVNISFPYFAIVDLISKKMWSFDKNIIVNVNRKNTNKDSL